MTREVAAVMIRGEKEVKEETTKEGLRKSIPSPCPLAAAPVPDTDSPELFVSVPG